MYKILLNPGHSDKKPGAQGFDPKVKEEKLNIIQANACKDALLAFKNYSIDFVRSENNDLYWMGQQAKGYDAFISLHLNATGNRQIDYTMACVSSRNGKKSSVILASDIALNIGTVLNKKIYGGDLSKGVNALPLIVLNSAELVCLGPCVLTEAFFLSTDNSLEYFEQQSKIAGKLIAESIHDYFQMMPKK